MILVRTYATRQEAVDAAAAVVGAVYLHEHREGTGPDDYVIQNPSHTAARRRAAGVHTERPVVVLKMADGTVCVPVPAVVTPASGTLHDYVQRRVVAGSDPSAVPLTRAT